MASLQLRILISEDNEFDTRISNFLESTSNKSECLRWVALTGYLLKTDSQVNIPAMDNVKSAQTLRMTLYESSNPMIVQMIGELKKWEDNFSRQIVFKHYFMLGWKALNLSQFQNQVEVETNKGGPILEGVTHPKKIKPKIRATFSKVPEKNIFVTKEAKQKLEGLF